MAQTFQMIGQGSDELERVAAERQGWPGMPAEPLAAALTDQTDFTWLGRRAHTMALGLQGHSSAAAAPPLSMAGYEERPMVSSPSSPSVGALREGPDGVRG